MELASDADAASAFVNGIIPADMAQAVAKQQEENAKKKEAEAASLPAAE
jgi:hypothetical protein